MTLTAIPAHNTFKEVNIQVHSDSPFILFSRTRLKDAHFTLQDGRLQVRNSDKFKTMICNIPVELIEDLMCIRLGNTMFNIKFKVQGNDITITLYI